MATAAVVLSPLPDRGVDRDLAGVKGKLYFYTPDPNFKLLFMHKKWLSIVALVFITACAKEPARDIEGTYAGNFSLVGVGSGQATVEVTALGDNLVRINFAAAGVDPIFVNGAQVSEQTTNAYGVAYSDNFYTLVGAVDPSEQFDFQYSGDTLFLSFSGHKQ